MLSRYAEYEMFEMAEKHHLHSCFECGLCSFNCTVRRPILQYIRFAKDQLLASGQGEGLVVVVVGVALRAKMI